MQLKVKVEHHANDQYQVLVNGLRVAYVSVGKDRPINYLPKQCSGVAMITEEKIALARYLRDKVLPVLNRQTAEQKSEIFSLLGKAGRGSVIACEAIDGVITVGENKKAKGTNDTTK